MTTANAAFGMTSWNEEPYSEVEGELKLTRAEITNTITGAIEGASTLTYLLTYLSDGSASFTGQERVIGRIGDRQGSFVLQHQGEFRAGTATGTLTIISGSGTADLAGISGTGSYTATDVQPTPFVLEYDLPTP